MANAALSKKAEDVVILHIGKLSSFTDYFVIASGSSERQVRAIATAIEETLKEKGTRPIGMEGAVGSQWVLVDYGNVVAHVFHESARMFYDLEGLWAKAARVRLEEARAAAGE